MISRTSFKLYNSKLHHKNIIFTKISNFTSTRDIIAQRDQHFRTLLLSKDNLSPVELSNVARVLYKNKINISEEEAKKFDDQALVLAKTLDNQQLRQVMSYYIFTNKANKFVNYELNQRYKTVGLKDYTAVHVGNNIQAKVVLFLFSARNLFFKVLAKITGLSLK